MRILNKAKNADSVKVILGLAPELSIVKQYILVRKNFIVKEIADGKPWSTLNKVKTLVAAVAYQKGVLKGSKALPDLEF